MEYAVIRYTLRLFYAYLYSYWWYRLRCSINSLYINGLPEQIALAARSQTTQSPWGTRGAFGSSLGTTTGLLGVSFTASVVAGLDAGLGSVAGSGIDVFSVLASLDALFWWPLPAKKSSVFCTPLLQFFLHFSSSDNFCGVSSLLSFSSKLWDFGSTLVLGISSVLQGQSKSFLASWTFLSATQRRI